MSKTPKNILLNMQDLGKVFPGGTHALANVHLQIPRGQFVSIVGPSGCGKSTLIRLVAGLDNYTSGTLNVDGQDPINARKKRNDLAYVFQDPTLLPWRTVYKNVTLPLELRGQVIDDRITAILETVGLSDFLTAFPSQLSGGMRMRVSIARALATDPGLLLLDEPFGALDEITRQLLNEELLKLWERDRWTGLFITHNVYEATFLADRVLVMSARPGRIIADIEVPFSHPRDKNLRHQSSFTDIAHCISNRLEEAHQ
ncbi:MAG: ABC transporter ATP-binding protein [Candidatus Latescibacterota bacterium]|nr:ABC transporter ATP-binding protein [Candidatus Latescibacterota bacterium]